MKTIKILGSGCKACNTLESLTKEALANLGQEADVQKVTDFALIMKYGVMKTPALVIDEKVVISGRVPKLKEVEEFLK